MVSGMTTLHGGITCWEFESSTRTAKTYPLLAAFLSKNECKYTAEYRQNRESKETFPVNACRVQ